MKNYRGYWKNRILSDGERNYGRFCREHEPDDTCVYFFCYETNNNGPCFSGCGMWRWSDDINELASWVVEFQFRNMFACCDEGRDITDTLDMSGTEYLKHIAESHKGLFGYETRKAVYELAKELDSMIYAGQLSFEWFAQWLKKLESISKDMPVMLEYQPFATIDDAMTLIWEHEDERGECLDEVDDVNRFEVDIQC